VRCPASGRLAVLLRPPGRGHRHGYRTV